MLVIDKKSICQNYLFICMGREAFGVDLPIPVSLLFWEDLEQFN